MGKAAKTHRGAAKRFKVTGKGKIVARKKGLRHILSNKNRKRKRGLKGNQTLSPAAAKQVQRTLNRG